MYQTNVFFLIVALLPLQPLQGSPRELTIVCEAARASASNLTSGRGSGTFLRSSRQTASEPWKLELQAGFDSYFSGGKYHVDLKTTSEAAAHDRRVIVFDGAALATSRFSQRIKPFGAEGTVYSEPGGNAGVLPTVAGFPWDVSKLVNYLLNFDAVLATTPIQLTSLENGDISGEYSLSKACRMEFLCPQESGFNVAEAKCVMKDSGIPLVVMNVKWKRKNNVWFVSAISEEHTPVGRDQWREELVYNDCSPNVPIDEELFTIGALDLPQGARLIDQRHEVADSKRVHHIPVDDDTVEAGLDTIASQIVSLPNRQSPVTQVETRPNRMRFWLIAVNLLVVLLLVVALVIRARRRGLQDA